MTDTEFRVMPFGLKNAPSTFQSLMNDVFRKYLRKFILVFFDDILIYSTSRKLHLEHLRTALQLLSENHLVINVKKCVFAQSQLEYLGHIIFREGGLLILVRLRVWLNGLHHQP